MRETVDAPTSGRRVLCWAVVPHHSVRGLHGGAAAGRISRTPACLEGSRVVAPPCRNGGVATALTPVQSAGGV